MTGAVIKIAHVRRRAIVVLLIQSRNLGTGVANACRRLDATKKLRRIARMFDFLTGGPRQGVDQPDAGVERLENARRNPDDLKRQAVEAQGAPDDARIALEMRFPE